MEETFEAEACGGLGTKTRRARIIETKLNRKDEPNLKYNNIISILLGVVFIVLITLFLDNVTSQNKVLSVDSALILTASCVIFALSFLWFDVHSKLEIKMPEQNGKAGNTLVFDHNDRLVYGKENLREIFPDLEGNNHPYNFHNFMELIVQRRSEIPSPIRREVLLHCQTDHGKTVRPLYNDLVKDKKGHNVLCSIFENESGEILCRFENIDRLYGAVLKYYKDRKSLVSSVHDLNNILAIINGYTHVCSSLALGGDQSALLKNCEKMQTSVLKGSENVKKIQDCLTNQSSHFPLQTANLKAWKQQKEILVSDYDHGVKVAKTPFDLETDFKKISFKGYTGIVINPEKKTQKSLCETLESLGINAIPCQSKYEALSVQDTVKVDIDFLLICVDTNISECVKFTDLFAAVRPEASALFLSGVEQMREEQIQSQINCLKNEGRSFLNLPIDRKELVLTLLSVSKQNQNIDNSVEMPA